MEGQKIVIRKSDVWLVFGSRVISDDDRIQVVYMGEWLGWVEKVPGMLDLGCSVIDVYVEGPPKFI